MRYELDGKTREGHWEFYGTSFGTEDDPEYVKDAMWEYVKENCDLGDEIEDAIDDDYCSASNLYNHMMCGGYDVDDVKEEALRNIYENLDDPEVEENYCIGDNTFEWIQDDTGESEEEIRLNAIKEEREMVINLKNIFLDKVGPDSYHAMGMAMDMHLNTVSAEIGILRTIVVLIEDLLSEKIDALNSEETELKKKTATGEDAPAEVSE